MLSVNRPPGTTKGTMLQSMNVTNEPSINSQKSPQKYQMHAPNGICSAPRFGWCLQNVDRCRQMCISPREVGGGIEPTSALLLIRCRGLFLFLSISSPPTHKHILICIYLLSLPVALNCSRDEGNRANCISINLLRVCE